MIKKDLSQKLGIIINSKVIIFNQPDSLIKTLGDFSPKTRIEKLPLNYYDLIQIFSLNKAELLDKLPQIKPCLKKNGFLWISWPKKNSSILSDLDKNIVREIGLEIGLVDVKVCSIDEIWSSLKFVYRLSDR